MGKGDASSSWFGCRLRLPELEILESGIGFEDVEEGVDGQKFLNVFDREMFQASETIRRPIRDSAEPDGIEIR